MDTCAFHGYDIDYEYLWIHPDDYSDLPDDLCHYILGNDAETSAPSEFSQESDVGGNVGRS